MRVGETPVPIPNTMVKTDAADNTWLETAREDRWLPDHGGLAQLGERLPCKQEVTSSNLVFSTVLTLHLENNVLSVACRHAIKQNILKLMGASFQGIKYLFCNVP